MSPLSTRPRVLADRRVRALAALTTVAALTLSACSDDASAPAEEGPEGQAIAEGVDMMGQWPLTGLPADTR
jgi:hypothetical protein